MIDERFMRTELLLGNQALKNLQNSTVALIGVGAVGGYALEALARAGVGHLILVDFDTFDITNINRQILALTSTVGQKKVEVARRRVLDINPKCDVKVEDIFISDENFDKIFNDKIDFVVDAMDSMKEKCDMMYFLYQKGIPFISSMGAALKTDISALKIAKLSKTNYCPMSKKIRKSLVQRGVDMDKITCVYCAEQKDSGPKPIIASKDGSKAVLGSLPTITAMAGLMMAHYVIFELSKGDKNAKYT